MNNLISISQFRKKKFENTIPSNLLKFIKFDEYGHAVINDDYPKDVVEKATKILEMLKRK